MRDNYGRQTTSVLTWLICALVAGFVIQSIFEKWFHVLMFNDVAALSASGLAQGRFWTLLTYPLMHGHVLHLLVNCLLIFFLGRELQPLVGDRRLGWLALAASVGGGLVWFAVNFGRSGFVTGASAVVLAYLVVFACLYPQREIRFLLFFFVPVTLKPVWVVATLAALDFLACVLIEVPGGRSAVYVASSLHLGGMIVGWLYYRYVHQREWQTPDGRAEIELPRWFKKTKTAAVPAPAFKVNVSNRDDLRAEVDRILDKINSDGFGALTADEKRLLDEARTSMTRR